MKKFALIPVMFCFFAMGIPLIDAVMLRKSQLKDGYITYQRQKTKRQVRIKIGDICMRIPPPGR